MKYLALDVETTSLDPVNGQLLQIGLCVDDLSDPKPLDELPKMNIFVYHTEIKGQPFALYMNDWILRIIAEVDELPEGAIMSDMAQLNSGLYTDENGNVVHTNNPVLNFLKDHFLGIKDKITIAGKNAAGFDIPFLPKSITSCFHHRTIDVGSMYLEDGDEVVPNLAECLKRAEIDKEVSHCALEDAMDVVRLVRKNYGISID